MARKCPPGVLCIETYSVVLFSFFIFILFFIYQNNKTSDNVTDAFILPTQEQNMPDTSIPISNKINIPTHFTNAQFSQVGIATNEGSDSNIILPLIGKKLLPSRNSWQYYCMSDQNNSIRLPVSFNGKNCMDEYGCDELYNNDTIYIDGYNDLFKITIYEHNNFSYSSFI